ncbi:MAG: beta-propeller domain-containing protein [Granulosicoccus sp.]
MKTVFAAAATLLLTSPVAFAAPTITDNTITWPDDGWYQVQRTDTYETICEGTTFCEVMPGNYVVINHTTGERFVDIQIGAPVIDEPPAPLDDSVIDVSGNIISWPDDGWYQVQSADSFEIQCNGESFCDVDDGNYVVINHTTGQRFENVLVGEPGRTYSDSIEVSGNTIFWPDDGWYQVQTSDTYENLCNGGSSCDVPNGVYTVINHTTGQRFTGVTVSADAGLETFDSAEGFYTALKEALINNAQTNGTFIREDFLFADADGIALPEAAPQPPSADSAPSVDAGNDVTSTNVQEVGVDEQDRVKVNASGTQLFVLSNEFNYDGPNVFPPEPAPGIVIDEPVTPPVPEPEPGIVMDEPALEPEIVIDEPAVEPVMLIDEPLIADSSFVAPPESQTTLSILALDADTPDARSINDLSIDLEGRNADGFYLYETDAQSSAIITASGGGFWGFWRQPAAFGNQQSVIAKVDVTDAERAALTDTFTIDGRIISSRRIGDALFFASRYYPSIPGFEPWQTGSEEWRDIVENTDLATLMPEYSRNDDEESTSLVDASACFVAQGALDQKYYSPDIITLGVIDLATMQLRDSECFLGATETFYANTESVFLATTRHSYSEGPITLDGTPVDTDLTVIEPDIEWFDPRTSTDIHRFDITSDELTYAGSGTVDGHLGWNELQKPFRMSEKDGYLRVATMNDRQGREHSPILLTILQADGEGNLETVSRLPNETNPEFIGKPGEQLYASRFIGDRAYLVTFRQTDPLYTIDLSDPANPKVTGELEIEGYSDYLQPVGENHLLGIGKNAVAANGGFGDGRGAWVQGIKLALFDISDPAFPTEVQSLLLGERGSDSVALRNHRAITIQPANDQHPMRVSFGADIYGEASPIASPLPEEAFNYKEWNYTGLHGYDIIVGANPQIIPRGALVIDINNSESRRFPSYGDDRSVMVNDAVFYVHGAEVYPALWDDLSILPQER